MIVARTMRCLNIGCIVVMSNNLTLIPDPTSTLSYSAKATRVASACLHSCTQQGTPPCIQYGQVPYLLLI
jgi:hypothetical protein